MAADVSPDGVVRVDGHGPPFTVIPCGDGCYRVSDGTRAWVVWVAGAADGWFVGIGGAAARLDIDPEGEPARKRGRGGHADATSAPMPGTVIEILVGIGQHVEAGDVLLTLEAMKMELPIRAPRAGTVSALHCRDGELVQPGVVLVDLT